MKNRPEIPDDEDPVVLPIKPEIDLHFFRPQDVGPVVKEYLAEAFQKGYRDVVLIHGKGLGIQRDNVRRILSRTDFVENFQDAPWGKGGLGATMVHLKRRDENP
ncbi:MAG: Smr/MutS family protein [Spirochaetales bacterium]|nr:Smr/MutS family protein [Spirochaetales bacterium]